MSHWPEAKGFLICTCRELFNRSVAGNCRQSGQCAVGSFVAWCHCSLVSTCPWVTMSCPMLLRPYHDYRNCSTMTSAGKNVSWKSLLNSTFIVYLPLTGLVNPPPPPSKSDRLTLKIKGIPNVWHVFIPHSSFLYPLQDELIKIWEYVQYMLYRTVPAYLNKRLSNKWMKRSVEKGACQL